MMNNQYFYSRVCGFGVGVQKETRDEITSSSEGSGHFSFFSVSKLPLMMIMMTMMGVAVVVLGDDTQSLRDTLSSLCSLNKEGTFGSCCENYDINSMTLVSSSARDCFLSDFYFTSDYIITFLSVLLI